MGEPRHDLYFCALAPLAIERPCPTDCSADPAARTFWGSQF